MSNEFNENIQSYEVSIERAKHMVSLGESLEALAKNKHWKAVVENHFFDAEVKRLVFMQTNPVVSKEGKEDLIAELEALARFRSMLHVLGTMSNQFKHQLEVLENDKEAYIKEYEQGDTYE
jgi:hypothetical protein